MNFGLRIADCGKTGLTLSFVETTARQAKVTKESSSFLELLGIWSLGFGISRVSRRNEFITDA